MEKKLTIGIDVDGVLRDNLQIMIDLYNKNFNDKMTVDDIKDFRTEITFPIIETTTGKTASEWFFQDHSNEIFLQAKCFNNVVEDIKKLREYANVIIITYQKSLLNKTQTLKWLNKNGIEYDGIVFAKDKTKFLCDILIDDNDWNFIGSNAVTGILITAPYNKNKSLEELKSKSNCHDIIRMDSLHQFVEKFVENQNDFIQNENDDLKLDKFLSEWFYGVRTWGLTHGETNEQFCERQAKIAKQELLKLI